MTEIMVGACSELADGDHRIVAVGELEVGIFRLGDRFVAYENRCPHHGGPVCQGKLFNRVEEIIMPDQTSRGLRFSKDRHVVCPWHGYEFDLDTGSPSRRPARSPAADTGARSGRWDLHRGCGLGQRIHAIGVQTKRDGFRSALPILRHCAAVAAGWVANPSYRWTMSCRTQRASGVAVTAIAPSCDRCQIDAHSVRIARHRRKSLQDQRIMARE